MAIYKRGKVYWYAFLWNAERVQESTKQGNPRVARQMEAAHRTSLAKGEVGLRERKPVPVLKDFAQRFIDAIQVRCAEKPRTVAFYAEKLARLLEFEQLASANLDRIDEAMIESYVQDRRQRVSPATVNRQLATLRRLLRLAYEWQVINRVPRIQLLPGERCREYVLSHELEKLYLESTPQPLRDVALLILDGCLRIGEALSLDWRDVRLEPVGNAKFGYLRVRDGKSKNARRNVSLTARVASMLHARLQSTISPWVFPSDGGPYLVTSLDHLHSKARKLLKLPGDFVLHSLRHTMLTRLGEAGVDAFTIMRIAGHSSVTTSQRYVHPSPEAVERAFERLETHNAKATAAKLPVAPKRLLPTTVFTTVEEATPVSH